MAVNIEDILLLRAQQEAQQNQQGTAVAAGAGAALDAGTELYVGNDIHQVGKELIAKTRLLLAKALLVMVSYCKRMPRTGARAAMGLIGLVLGGGLGPAHVKLSFKDLLKLQCLLRFRHKTASLQLTSKPFKASLVMLIIKRLLCDGTK